MPVLKVLVVLLCVAGVSMLISSVVVFNDKERSSESKNKVGIPLIVSGLVAVTAVQIIAESFDVTFDPFGVTGPRPRR